MIWGVDTEPVTWERDEHTKAKHDLLLGVLQQVGERPLGVVRQARRRARPHLRWFRRVPGVYDGGEAGSPVILLRALCRAPATSRAVGLVDYELQLRREAPARAAKLREQLERLEARCGMKRTGASESPGR